MTGEQQQQRIHHKNDNHRTRNEPDNNDAIKIQTQTKKEGGRKYKRHSSPAQSAASEELLFKQWLYSLTLQEFSRVLQFTFFSDESSSVGGSGLSHARRGVVCPVCARNKNGLSNKTKQRRGKGKMGGGCDLCSSSMGAGVNGRVDGTMGSRGCQSHEFDLLKEMIGLQAPPPTPIHPRALNYKPATKDGATDGRDRKKRIRQDRFSRPRLFQLIERRSNGCSTDTWRSAGAVGRSSQNNLRRKRSHNQPVARRWDVVCKSFRSPWGEELGVGVTHRQREADANLLRSIRVWKFAEESRGSLCVSCRESESISSCKDNPSSRNVGREYETRQEFSSLSTNELPWKLKLNTVTDWLDLLRITSRGKFLSRTPTEDTDHPPFCAPWFSPTEWFSIPCYLTSRLEVGLRYKFRQEVLSGAAAVGETGHRKAVDNGPTTSLERTLATTPYKDVLRAVRRSISMVVRENLARGKDTSVGLLEDFPMKKLLDMRCSYSTFSSCVPVPWMDSILSCSLLDLETPRELFREQVQQALKGCLAELAERALLGALDAEGSNGCKTSKAKANGSKAGGADSTVTNQNQNNKNQKFHKPKKKKKKKKKHQHPSSSLPSKNVFPSGVDDKNDLASTEEDEDDSMEDAVYTARAHKLGGRDEATNDVRNGSHLPKHPHQTEIRNANTIMVLKIVEEVIETVFEKVGFPSNKEAEMDDGFCDTPRRAISLQSVAANETSRRSLAASTEIKRKVVKSNVKPKSSISAAQNSGCHELVPASAGESMKPGEHQSSVQSEKACPHGSDNFTSRVIGKKAGRTTLSGERPPPVPRHKSQGAMYTVRSDGVGCSVSSGLFPTEKAPPPPNHEQTDQMFQNIISSALSHDEPVSDVTSSVFDASLDLSGAFDGWRSVKKIPREKSLFVEFFMDENKDVDHQQIASSTAASIASSSRKDVDTEVQIDVCDTTDQEVAIRQEDLNQDTVDVADGAYEEQALAVSSDYRDDEEEDDQPPKFPSKQSTSSSLSSLSGSHPSPSCEQKSIRKMDSNSHDSSTKEASASSQPALLVSLAELGELKKIALPDELRKELTRSLDKDEVAPTFVPGSVPSSPKIGPAVGLNKSWSKDNLSALSVQEETPKRKPVGLSRQADALLSVRKQNLSRPFVRTNSVPFTGETLEDKATSTETQSVNRCPSQSGLQLPACEKHTGEPGVRDDMEVGDCTLSEPALDEDKKLHCEEKVRTSQSKVHSEEQAAALPHVKTEEDDEGTLREQRDAYRDMCLTLGAELSKLRNMLSSELCCTVLPAPPLPGSFVPPFCHTGAFFEPAFVSPFVHDMAGGSMRNIAMSDAGVQRGDHDSIRSDDLVHGSVGTDNNGLQWRYPPTDSGTVVGSDVSIDQSGQLVNFGFRAAEGRRMPFDIMPLNGLHSRLSTDISKFLHTIGIQLRKNDNNRQAAITRLKSMVTTLWPRAQVKLYGSHVTNLSLPSSDLDFVICLPAVHKNAPAVAPGALEGRNAVNESCQKLLARNLKGESWIDPRTIKIIERTAVPVIKVSTKDARARILQLDISFDGPEHHGLQAVNMVTAIMEEFPMLRPLVLVLKQFLLDRGLLTAYTGGLSSYCLFLMMTRYLQEQSSVWCDCGSLLMGFLDFFGNSFDPSTTGISVKRRQYFSRQHDARAALVHNRDQMWPIPHHQQQFAGPSALGTNLNRRHSFTMDRNAEEGRPYVSPPRHGGMKPPRGHRHANPANQHNFHPPMQPPPPVAVPSSRPYTFDPLFVEDPLSAGNNVGRNAFRIFQIKRAFADAHRALVASLEWDIGSTDMDEDCPYPLLKCLLQNEDIFIR